jgi:hypothetical protein
MANIKIQRMGPKVLYERTGLLPAADLERYLHNFSNRAGLVAV